MTPNSVGQITLGQGDIEAFQNRKTIKIKVKMLVTEESK
jgi:hypothetical protein